MQNQPRRTKRNNHRNATPPAWEQGQKATNGQGDFDEQGKFVAPRHEESEDPMYEDMDVISGNKRPSKKQQRPKKAPPPRQNGGVSPGRTNQHNTHHNTHANAPPPVTAMTPIRGGAYAGPSFNASPHASKLPLPKLPQTRILSKSTPAATTPSSMQARLDQEVERKESPPLADAAPPMPTPPPRDEESPLNIFFKADREEKAKRKSTGLLMTPTSKPALVSQYSEPGPRDNLSQIYSRPTLHNRQYSSGVGKGMFTMEMDGASSPTHEFSPPNIPANGLSDFRCATAPSTIPQTAPPAAGCNQQNYAQNGHHVYQAPNHGYSMPTLPYNTPPPSSGYTPGQDQNASPFYRPNLPHTPRSAGSTPIQGNNSTPNQQALHYGNQNLSPMFKAVKQDSARRASNLRQEVHASSPLFGPAELPGNAINDSPSRRPSSQANEAAMAYLSSVAPPPRLPNLRSLSSNSVPPSFAPAELSTQHQRQPSGNITPRQTAPRQPSGAAKTQADIKSMEQGLRQILNLNAYGSAAGVGSVR
ncbi:hypothetical protein EJ08DRAFT_656954 [Tothia fuscella]|uniref:Uncharacterized protein n=1 Tax=Tothia fuscella TaxID=1048955 RepID=A0A9P4U370_9PEZI|nr:hypothetical protein EJ08DRAFT_656954 [Tothia fuscella]